MAKCKAPDQLDFTKPDSWPMWRRRFDRYRSATALNGKPGQVQVDTLIYTMGPEAEALFDSFTFAAPVLNNSGVRTNAVEERDYDIVIKKFEDHFIPKRNTIHERAKFHSRVQRENEGAEEFIRDLYKLSEHCKFEMRDEVIRDRIVIGIKDAEVSKKLQETGDELTLEKAIEKVRQAEFLEINNAQRANSQSVDAVMRRGSRRGNYRPSGRWRGNNYNGNRGNNGNSGNNGPDQNTGQSDQQSNRQFGQRGNQHGRRGYRGRQNFNNRNKCGRCGGTHFRNQKCPAENRNCYRCGGLGHLSYACRNQGQREVLEVSNQFENFGVTPQNNDRQNNDPSHYFLGTVTTNQLEHENIQVNDNNNSADESGNVIYLEDGDDDDVLNYAVNGVESGQDTSPWVANVKLNDTQCTFKIDTGADVSVISKEVYDSLREKPKISMSPVVLTTPGGILKHSGQFIGRIVVNDKLAYNRIFVVEGITNNLLCGSAASRLGLVKRLFQINNDGFGKLKCEPVKIKLIDNANPYSVQTPRRVPVNILPKVEQELNKLERNGIIQKITDPTEWCSPMVPVVKHNGDIRICVDLNKLNKNILRERFIMPTIEELLPKLAGAVKFTKLDLHSGFYQIPLAKESHKLTTFITPLGRYCFRRVPFGISSAPEIFQRTMSELFRGVDGVIVLMDDLLVFGSNDREHDQRLSKILEMIKGAGLKLNDNKCVYNQSCVDFFGHTIGSKGISPSKGKVEAILKMNPPTDVSGVRRIMGMVNYLGRFLPDLSEVANPLNELLHADKVFCWDRAQEQAFSKIKSMISQAPVLAFYDVNKPTVVSADASFYGIGGVLLQEHPSGLKPVAFYSRTLNKAEKGYAQIEKECLASVCACERFEMYLTGLQSFKLLTDQKPLVPIFNNRDIDQAPIRCQRLLMRMMRFNANAVHTPGKNLVISDTLSRSPIDGKADNELEDVVEAYVGSIQSSWPATECKLDDLRWQTRNDSTLQQVMFYTTSGWPKSFKEVSPEIGPYFNDRGSLSVVDGLLVHGIRIVIPEGMRDEVLSRLHEGHQGMVKCSERAKSSVWWPGINAQIQKVVLACEKCQMDRPSQRKEPLVPSVIPERPWAKVAVDFAEFKGQKYLVLVCYYSRYIEIAHMDKTDAYSVVCKLKSIFARFGVPEQLVTDNGPPFGSKEFKEFVRWYEMEHITTSPYNPQSNGQVERSVQIAKHILSQEDPFLALMSYRATTHTTTGFSPARLLLGREIRTRVPTLPRALMPESNYPDHSKVVQNDVKAKQSQAFYYDRRNGARSLTHLEQGDKVRVKLDQEKRWGSPMTVQARFNPRSYIVRDERGHEYRRNRRHLQSIPSCVQAGDSPSRTISPPQESSDVVGPSVSSPKSSNNHCPSPHRISIQSPSPDPGSQPLSLSTQGSSQMVTRTRSGRQIRTPQKLDL